MEQHKDCRRIRYAAVCFTGKVRQNNEDNLCILGQYLPEIHRDLDHIVSGLVSCAERPVFGVFDGMGGESCGEVASYLGAQRFSETLRHSVRHPDGAATSAAGAWKRRETVSDEEEALLASLLAANDAVCDYAARNRISVMGTTAAVVSFSGDSVICGNVGDSRIYLYRDGNLMQVSIDHSARSIFGKGGLTQFIGIPPREMQIEPEVNAWPVPPCSKVLVCSDGVTNMLSDSELSLLVGWNRSPEEILSAMQRQIMNRGAVDNATAVLCEVR